MLRRAITLALLAASPATADLYPDALLEASHARVGAEIEVMITKDIPAAMPFEDRAAAAGIAVEFHYRADHPLNFFADAAGRTVYVPMESVRFISDLAILTAWFDARGCPSEPIATYLWALLREGRELPPPFEAFAIDRDVALADPFVDDVSLKASKTAFFFLFAHEVGHVVLGHAGGITGAASVEQEIAADAFALDRFAALGTYPGGMALYFFAGRWLDPTAAVDSDLMTHPVSPDRLRAIADRLAHDPAAFAASEPDPTAAAGAVSSIAAELATLADLMADDAMLTLLPLGLDRDFPLSRLASACPD